MKGQLFYGKNWVTGSGTLFCSEDPAIEKTIWSGNAANAENVDDAVKSARDAFVSWAALDYKERESHVLSFQNRLEKEKESLAELISRETGKPFWESSAEVQAMCSKVTLSIKAYHERTGDHFGSTSPTTGEAFVLRHRPHGVMAVFGPYNFPGHLPNGHIVPALLAGNTVVFKPSELTPAVGEAMTELWERSGLPAGVINLVQGEAETGKALANHPLIDGLLFTGSSRTGHILHNGFAGQPEKILALEMGGNNPLVVDDTVDVNAAVYGIIQSAFITSGQRCTCARRLFVPDTEKGNRLVSSLIKATSLLTTGRWNDAEAPFMGPLVSAGAANEIIRAQKQLVDSGAKALLPVQQLPDGKAWLSPGIVDVTSVTSIPDEEYFGPLLQLVRYQSFEGAVKEANNTRYGLSAGLFSNDKERFDYFCRNIRAGIINWNRQTTGASGSQPFGGTGASGNHRPGAWYAADYCAYPVASVESETLTLPEKLLPGVTMKGLNIHSG